MSASSTRVTLSIVRALAQFVHRVFVRILTLSQADICPQEEEGGLGGRGGGGRRKSKTVSQCEQSPSPHAVERDAALLTQSR